ncbi:hypothetical protein BDV32DRAFT_116873 [Aspergillus pseudonomiae]|nr:hypothetical protein BDV32DRAFT_116873 [Aspergillus pseudonomiae]
MVVIYITYAYSAVFTTERTILRSAHSHISHDMFSLSWHPPENDLPPGRQCRGISINPIWTGWDVNHHWLRLAVKDRALEELAAEWRGETGEECIWRTLNEGVLPPERELRIRRRNRERR